ncbi:MAG: DUF2834 domain-containing protein [Pseudomonadota bacterium]
MTRVQKQLCLFYGLAALAALAATWSQNLAYFGGVRDLGGLVGAGVDFVIETRTTPAGRSITVDLLALFLAASAFMIHEARRLGISHVWAYILLGFLVAISVTFPLFMIARERALAWTGEAPPDRPAPWADRLGLTLMTALILALGAVILRGG